MADTSVQKSETILNRAAHSATYPASARRSAPAEPANRTDQLSDHYGVRNVLPELESEAIIAFWHHPWRHERHRKLVYPAVEPLDEFSCKAHVVRAPKLASA